MTECCGRDYFSSQLELQLTRESKKKRAFRTTMRQRALAASKRHNRDYIQPVRRRKYPWSQPPISVSKKWLEDRGIETYPF